MKVVRPSPETRRQVLHIRSICNTCEKLAPGFWYSGGWACPCDGAGRDDEQGRPFLASSPRGRRGRLHLNCLCMCPCPCLCLCKHVCVLYLCILEGKAGGGRGASQQGRECRQGRGHVFESKHILSRPHFSLTSADNVFAYFIFKMGNHSLVL